MNDTEGEDEFSALVLPEQPGAARALRPRQFAAWHEPRKQWIRLFQWRDGVERLIDEVSFPTGSEVLRYLGMPGEDMLDIRLLRELCEKRGIELHFTGVVAATRDEDRDQLNLSETAIRRMAYIHRSSQIVVDRFEAIGQGTPTQRSVRQAGPYHVVNADLTGHYAAMAPTGTGKTYIEALGEIVDIQIRRARDPWLLFLTTRLNPEQTHSHNLQAFVRAIYNNIEASTEFHVGMQRMLLAEAAELKIMLADPGNLSGDHFKNLFCIGLGKWLLSYLQRGVPPQAVKMLESLYYSVRLEHDMLSLAYLITPLSRKPTDGTGLLPARREEPEEISEVNLGLELLQATSELVDIDRKLMDNPDLTEQMITESLLLLRQANYVVDNGGAAYRTWLEGRKRPSH